MKWPDELCDSCRHPMPKKGVYCLRCQWVSLRRVKEDAASRQLAREQRAQRQTHAFQQEFDKRAFELVLARLKSLDQVTVTDLIDILYAEGFFDKYRTGVRDANGELHTLPEDVKQLKFLTWARKRVLGLAKWWAKHEVAFIGAKVAQGHPYLFYLGKKPDAVFDPTLPKKSIAQRSVNRAVATKERLSKQLNETEVSA